MFGPRCQFLEAFHGLISHSSEKPGLKFSFLKQQVFDFCSEMATVWLGQTELALKGLIALSLISLISPFII